MKHWISPDIRYKTFKLLNDKLSPQDLAPKNYTKIMWEMIKDRKINCFIDDMSKEDAIFFTLKDIPKEASIISSPLNKGKELQKMIDNQEICIRCGMDRKVIRRDNSDCIVYGKYYPHHIYK